MGLQKMSNGIQPGTGEAPDTLIEAYQEGSKLMTFDIWIEPPSVENNPIDGSVGSSLSGES